MSEATSRLLLLLLLDTNETVGCDFVNEMRSADEFGERRILLEYTQDIGVFGHITEHMGMKASGRLFALCRRGFNDGFVQLAFFENVLAIGRNQITDIAAEWIDPSL